MYYHNNEDREQTLALALEKIAIDSQADIPWIVRLLENPQSPLALPGKISLYDHDCLHVLLDRSTNLYDEAFVIGFTMGNDSATKRWHVFFYKFFSRYFYPPQYRFTNEAFKYYERGFAWGKTFTVQFNKIDFQALQNWKIGDLRQKFGLANNSFVLDRKLYVGF